MEASECQEKYIRIEKKERKKRIAYGKYRKRKNNQTIYGITVMEHVVEYFPTTKQNDVKEEYKNLNHIPISIYLIRPQVQ